MKISIFCFYIFCCLNNIDGQLPAKNMFDILTDTSSKKKTARVLFPDVDNYDMHAGKKVTSFSLKDISGREFSNKSFTNKITLINFWFEACPSCHPQFEKLKALYYKYKHDSTFQIISFTFDNTETAQKVASRDSLPYTIISTPKTLITNLNFKKGYPSNYIIDGDGTVVFGHSGNGGYGSDVFNDIIKPEIDKQVNKLKQKN